MVDTKSANTCNDSPAPQFSGKNDFRYETLLANHAKGSNLVATPRIGSCGIGTRKPIRLEGNGTVDLDARHDTRGCSDVWKWIVPIDGI